MRLTPSELRAAVNYNSRSKAQQVGWLGKYSHVASALGLNGKPTAEQFAQAVATWQGGQKSFKPDGKLGPTSWRQLQTARATGGGSQDLPDWLSKPPAKTITFDGPKMTALLQKLMDGHVTYKMDGMRGKVSPLSSKRPEDVKFLDCSGFVQYVTYLTTSPKLKLRPGSWHQEDYFKSNGFEVVDYKTDAPKKDNVVRVAFRHKTEARNVRHVWFVINGKTIESTAKKGSNGPTMFDWNMRTKEAATCYVAGPVLTQIPRLFQPLSNSWFSYPQGRVWAAWR